MRLRFRVKFQTRVKLGKSRKFFLIESYCGCFVACIVKGSFFTPQKDLFHGYAKVSRTTDEDALRGEKRSSASVGPLLRPPPRTASLYSTATIVQVKWEFYSSPRRLCKWVKQAAKYLFLYVCSMHEKKASSSPRSLSCQWVIADRKISLFRPSLIEASKIANHGWLRRVIQIVYSSFSLRIEGRHAELSYRNRLYCDQTT